VTATQHSVNEHPYPASSRFIVPELPLALLDGIAPTETEDPSVSRHPNRFGGPHEADGGVFFPTATTLRSNQ